MTRKLNAVPEKPTREPAPDLREAVEAALAEMDWLKPSDDALKALALNYAEQIEAAAILSADLDAAWAEARGDKGVMARLTKLEAAANLTKMIGWLGPQLQGVLRDLGGTPAARKAMQVDAPAGGRLAQLRERAGRTAGGAGPADGAGQHHAEGVDPAQG